MFESLGQVREMSAEWPQSCKKERSRDVLAGQPLSIYRRHLESRSSPVGVSRLTGSLQGQLSEECENSMSRADMHFRAGEWVEIKGPGEIADTLDGNGAVDGLPFMPEMLAFCGRRFRILRRAEKTCFEAAPGCYQIREFRENDVLLLDGVRCSGADHDGCQRACMIFWKEVWLRRVEPLESQLTSMAPPKYEQLLSPLKTLSVHGRYFCQSTELGNATKPLTRPRILMKCLKDIRSGNRGILEMARLVLRPLWRKVMQRFSHRELTGTLKRTPVGDLKLQPRDWVEIRSEAEIVQTLNERGCNRGMLCDLGMTQHCGGRYQVRNRLDRMISEPSGEMRQVESTVILDGLHCLCWNVVGGCPRADFMYWREVWLKRSDRDSE